MAMQLIAEGSSKLASVPSGGAGGAPAAGGAAAGGAAAEAAKEEEKEEGMLHCACRTLNPANVPNREGGVRRGHGLRSLRLSILPQPPRSRRRLCGNFRRTFTTYAHTCDEPCPASALAVGLDVCGIRGLGPAGVQCHIDWDNRVQGCLRRCVVPDFREASGAHPYVMTGGGAMRGVFPAQVCMDVELCAVCCVPLCSSFSSQESTV